MSKAIPNLLDGHDTDRIQDEVGTEIRKTFAKSRKQTLLVKDITIPNDYRPLDYDKFKELLPVFEARGIKERIEVHERGSRYILLHGRLRLEAAMRLRLDEIKAIVFSDEYYKPQAEPRKKPKAPLPNELELVKLAREGDEGARNKLLEQFYWLAVKIAYKHRRGMEREEASGVAFDAIDTATTTWDPKRAKLSTWIGQKVRGELTTHRRNLRKQTRELTWIEPKRWVHRDRKNTKVIPIADNVVRIERLDDPSIYITAKVQKRKRGIDRLDAVVWQEREDEERARRNQARADLRLDTLARLLTERAEFDAWLKQRKFINKADQTIAKMLFCETHKVEWVEQIGRKRYLCGVWDTNWLPNEVCEELGITRSKLNAALSRICKTVTGFTDKELITLEDVRQGEREERIRSIPVPEPNLPRHVRKALTTIGREPTFDEAAKAVALYWRQIISSPWARNERVPVARVMSGESAGWGSMGPTPQLLERATREIVRDVADAIRGKSGPDYLRLAQCIEVLKRQG